MANFESGKKALPQATTGNLDANQAVNLYLGSQPQFSWIVRILPYMEQQQIFALFDVKKNYSAYITEDVTRVPTPERSQPGLLMCPSDSTQGRLFQTTGRVNLTGNRAFGKGNYVAYASPEHIECLEVAKGAFGNEPRPLSQVSDGTSNTLMLTEVRTRDDTEDERGAWTLAWNATSLLGADVHSTSTDLTRICGQSLGTRGEYTPAAVHAEYALLPNAPVPATSTGAMDNLRGCAAGSTTAVESAIDGMPCRQRGDTTAAPRSLHPGGVIVANVDASVRFLQDGIDPVSYGRLICINDGENSVQ